jgi:threonine/homoserine/homoserine lactone efflux protein
VGVLGFIPGITSPYQITLAGPASEAMLLGAFQVSILHNIVHLLYGVAGTACARTPAAARSFLMWGGAVYLVLWIYGLIISPDSGANFVPVNTPDNWLHFVLGAAMLALGLALGRNRARTPGRRP